MANTIDAPIAGPWPDASLLPAEDAPPIEWARFYRDVCGWVVLPTASPADVMAYAIALHNEALADFAVDHPGEDIPEETSAVFWDHARELAEATAGRPIGHLYNAWLKSKDSKPAKVTTAADVTDEMLALAWVPVERSRGPRATADQRGIAIMPNRSERGLPACLVDVDPRHGGDAEGPWGMGLAGPKASTPGGGVHTLMLATGKETASADLGPGVDVVAGGGTMIPVPAGSATPGRRWLRWEAMAPAPDALRRRGRKKAPPKPGEAEGGATGARERQPGDDDEPIGAGQSAALMLAPVGDGERNRVAGALVGILARPGACPSDFVQACLETLAEGMAGRDATAADIAAEAARWRHALTRGPRDADFAAEVLEVWYAIRNTASKRWKTTPRKFALSVWKVCDRREGGEAGAEDFGVGPALAARPASWPPLPTYVPAAHPIDHSADAPASPLLVPPPSDPGEDGPRADVVVPYPPPPPPGAAGAAPGKRWRAGVDPRQFVQSLAAEYSDDDLAADLAREPIQIGEVMPAVDFATGRPLARDPERLAAPLYHGWGGPLSAALGGMMAGDFRVIGASGAGAGKTWFACWLAHGLALQTACRLLGAPGFEDAPIVLPIWVSEMPKRSEMYLRLVGAHLGFDVAAIAAGTRAHEAPGVIAMAQQHGLTPLEIVARARDLERTHGATDRWPLGFARQHVVKRLRLSGLPRRTRDFGVVVDHRSGPVLIDHLADAVDCYREDFAREASVSADKVLPLIMLDPSQRFTADVESEKRAIDALFGATAAVLCGELGAAVIATSDTTKSAASNSDIDLFLGEDANALGARVLAGSYAIQHNADCLLLQAEAASPLNPLSVRMWARVIKSRSGGASTLAFPFTWSKHLGRFQPGEPEPLRPMPERDGERRGGGDGRRGGSGKGRERDRPGPVIVRPFGAGYHSPRSETLPD